MTGSEQSNHVQRMARIRELNDRFRKQLRHGEVLITLGIRQKVGDAIGDLFRTLARFDDFNEDNDPYGEHDFGCLTWQGDPIFWKIDYYDLDMTSGSPDPANPDVTTRVLTVMMAWEY